jgi:hypothetical protein
MRVSGIILLFIPAGLTYKMELLTKMTHLGLMLCFIDIPGLIAFTDRAEKS